MATHRRSVDRRLDAALQRIHHGDDRGYTELYELLGRRVAGYVRNRGVVDVEDVTNEVFLAAFRGMSDFTGDGERFRSWLFAIAWNKTSDWHRVASRRVPIADRLVEDVDRAGGDAEQEAIGRLGDLTVGELLATLTPDQRDVLLLRVVADLSLEETARVVGKPVGAVKSLQHRALAALERTIGRGPVSRRAEAANTELR